MNPQKKVRSGAQGVSISDLACHTGHTLHGLIQRIIIELFVINILRVYIHGRIITDDIHQSAGTIDSPKDI